MNQDRGQWKSKLGFVLAASGSAIGLGNVVFFGSNAYTYGFGAFYLPYLVALVVLGIPILISELALGGLTQRALPQSLGKYAGKWGEFAGWWGLINATFITMYYVTILAWVAGMLIGSFETLWQPVVEVPRFTAEELPNPTGFFFNMISSPWVLLLVAGVWAANLIIVRRGVETIEPVVKIFVPLMWIFMIVLVIRGLTLPHGIDGVRLLFTPDFEVMADPNVWRGAASQIFFSLSLGFGVMTAYASYLPKNADHANNGILTACLNCSFEYVAGLAIFSLLFAFAIVPGASTLSMIFFVVPQGIAAMPVAVKVFGLLFFLLLLLAGLSSSVSLIEALNTALIDKFGWSRRRTLTATSIIGFLGSASFALPIVIDPDLSWDATLGFTLIDLIDHWAFSHGLLVVGLVECLILGWKLPISRLREAVNQNSRFRLPKAFDALIKFVIPGVLIVILVLSAIDKVRNGLYGWQPALAFGQSLPIFAFLFWLVATCGVGYWLASSGSRGSSASGETDETDPLATGGRA